MSGTIILSVLLGTLLILEKIYPLRQMTHQVPHRKILNLSIALFSFLFSKFVSLKIVYLVASFFNEQQIGLFNQPFLSVASSSILSAQLILTVLFMDYATYWWHRWNHRVPFLWRFHHVHHADFDMDVTTAARFHFGELFLSSLLRVSILAVMGFQFEHLLIFDVIITASSLFHHSNLKISPRLHQFLNYFWVTPLYHQYHHSYYLNETDSNYCALFNFWDKVHRSHSPVNLKKAHIDMPMGVPSNTPQEVDSFLKLIILPFTKQKPWPKKYLMRT